MPMPAKGPHLALRKRKGRPDTWVIRDEGKVERATGTGDRAAAEVALRHYLADKQANRHVVTSGPLTPDQMTIEVALAHYVDGHGPEVVARKRLLAALKPLVRFWGHLPVSSITDQFCRAYVERRVTDGCVPNTARRELSVLQAAVNYCARKALLTASRSVLLPPAPDSHQRAMTRDEAAALLRAARRLGHKHVARFVLIALYTGTRKEAILGLRLDVAHTDGGWMDLKRGVLHRRAQGQQETNKRRPAARLPRQLWGHAKRWRAMGDTWAVSYREQRIGNLDYAFDRSVEAADLGWRPTPHTLKHTAITWAIASGASIEDAAGYFGTSPATIFKTYWDKSPTWQAKAVAAVERMGRRR